MKIVNSDNSSHEIVIIPRGYYAPLGIIELKNEETKQIENVSFSLISENGLYIITFNYSFQNKSNYQFKLKNSTRVIYRGKIYATNQIDLQNYTVNG